MKKSLLWVDDDGPDRFVYETTVLQDTGEWQIDWAFTVLDAVVYLNTKVFDAVILDQTLPYNPDEGAEYRGGCSLLQWLKTGEVDTIAIPDEVWTLTFAGRQAKPENQRIPVCIVSAFYDTEIQEALRLADPGHVFMPKPIEFEKLKRFLERGPT